MTVAELRLLLDTVEDDTIEVVFRVGENHGANIVSRVSHWGAIENPNHTNHTHAADLILPDNGYEGTDVLVLS